MSMFVQIDFHRSLIDFTTERFKRSGLTWHTASNSPMCVADEVNDDVIPASSGLWVLEAYSGSA